MCPSGLEGLLICPERCSLFLSKSLAEAWEAWQEDQYIFWRSLCFVCLRVFCSYRSYPILEVGHVVSAGAECLEAKHRSYR